MKNIPFVPSRNIYQLKMIHCAEACVGYLSMCWIPILEQNRMIPLVPSEIYAKHRYLGRPL